MCPRCRMHLVHSSVAYILLSALDRAVMVWRLDTQCNGPLCHIRKPDIDLDLKRGNDGLVVLVGTLASCGSQLASHTAVTGASVGNLMYALIFVSEGLLWKAMPWFLVPLT